MANWYGFIGQEDRIALLKKMHDAGKRAHTLLQGPPGTGKTTLANIISKGNLITVVGNQVGSPDKLAALLLAAKEQKVDTIFVDEVHSAKPAGLEMLYSVMEEGKLYAFGSSYDLDVYIIGATTDGGRLPKPFRDRFGLDIRLRDYNMQEMGEIIGLMAKAINLTLSKDVTNDIAKRSLGTPRVARRMVVALRNFGDKYHALSKAQEIIDLVGIAYDGLGDSELGVLEILWKTFAGGPVGLTTLSMACNIDEQMLARSIEPTLIKQGYLLIDKKGRLLSPEGVKRIVTYIAKQDKMIADAVDTVEDGSGLETTSDIVPGSNLLSPDLLAKVTSMKDATVAQDSSSSAIVSQEGDSSTPTKKRRKVKGKKSAASTS